MLLPNSNILPIQTLSQCFNNTTNSYKFYWFWAILEHLQTQNTNELKLEDLALRMVSLVWYPLDFYKLSFGVQDGFKQVAVFLSEQMNVDNSPKSASLMVQIQQNLDENAKKKLLNAKEMRTIIKYVPYRFQSPFFSEILRTTKDSEKNKLISQLANQKKAKVFYTYTENNTIILDEDWAGYFQEHQQLMHSFLLWFLLQFVQKNNPNTIGLSEKLLKPQARDLSLAHQFWEYYLVQEPDTQCIYSKTPLQTDISIDHFIPWSYVVHDQLWNLTPTTKSVNSSKSNALPKLDNFLDDFVKLQHKAFLKIYHLPTLAPAKKQKLLTDYANFFGLPLKDIANLSAEAFAARFNHTIQPMANTAAMMGFKENWVFVKK